MSSKQSMVVGLALVALVFVLANPMEATSSESKADRRLRQAFDDLDRYVQKRCAGKVPLDDDDDDDDDDACMKVIKATQSGKFSSFDEMIYKMVMIDFKYVKYAAKILLAVNGMSKCDVNDVKLIHYIDHIARLGPQKNYADPRNVDGDSRLRQLTGPLVERSIEMCKPFVDKWFAAAQEELGPSVQSDLDKLHGWLAEIVSTGKDGFHKRLARLALEDDHTNKQLRPMPNEQLVKFFANYIVKHVIEPCKSFVANMREVMGLGETFHLAGPTDDDLHFSSKWLMLDGRLEICNYVSTKKRDYIDHYARLAADEFSMNIQYYS